MSTEFDKELRLIVAPAISKFMPTKLRREMNVDYWAVVKEAEEAIKQAINKHIIGKDEEYDGKFDSSPLKTAAGAVIRNSQRFVQRKALGLDQERSL